jgi:TRAP-type C4-dicarboxylate transport system permease small subunit
MRKAYDVLLKILLGYSAVLLLAMLAIVLVGVFFRYLINEALSWYDEFAGYTLVWLTMYGSVVALARGKHISFETLVEKFSAGAQRVVAALSVLCILGFSVVVLVSGWELIREMGAETAVSITEVKMAWIYSVMPISAGLMILVGIVQLVTIVSGKGLSGEARPKAMEEGQ